MEDAETRFDTSNLRLDKPLPKEENKQMYSIKKDVY